MKSFLIFSALIYVIVAHQRNFTYISCPSKCVCYGKSVRCMKLNLEKIPRIPSVTVLFDLRFNTIREIQPASFKSYRFVRSLLLNNNLLIELKNGTFTGLLHLRHLYLHKNRLEHIASEVFQNLPKLEYLYLHSNNIKTLGDGTFSNLHSLERLFLYNNKIQRLSPKVFYNLPKLKRLRLDQNSLICDCKIAWLVNITNSNLLQVAAECKYPENMYGRSFKSLTSDDLHCEFARIISDPRDVKISVGETAVFSCEIHGKTSSIEWMRNEQKIDFTNEKYSMMKNGSLIIKNVGNEDKGSYECMVKMPDGMIKSRPARMILLDEKTKNYGSPIFFQKPVSMSTKTGVDSIHLFCKARGNPPPVISWSFNGVTLSSSNKHKIENDGTLTIFSLDDRDHGTYTCTATNTFGREKSSANIFINSPPVFTTQPENLEINIGGTIKTECVAVGSPKPEIIWYKENFEIIPSPRFFFSQDNSFLEIRNAVESDSGIYICKAKNTLGTREVAAEFKVKEIRTKPPRFLFKPYNLEAFVGNTIEMPCQAEGDPTPGITWQKDGTTMQRTGRAKISLTGSLYIYNIGLEDQGRYECIAINEHGRTTASGYLTVKDDPTAIKISGIGNQYVKIAFVEASEEVDKAINNTIKNLFSSKGPHNSGQLFQLFRYPDAPARELAKAAEIYERTLVNIRKHIESGMILNETQEFNYKEVLSKEHFDLIAQLSGCTTHRRINNCSNMCFHGKYRSINGICNNLQHPTWGASLTPFRRILPPIYEDGFGKPVGWDKNKKYHGFFKPLARKVSTALISTHFTTPDDEITHMVMQWGQFLDHDLDHALPSVSSQSWDGVDCKKTCDYAPPCFPMDVPRNDPRIRNRRCIDFIRTSSICGSGMTSVFFDEIQVREQVNQLTSYIDASQVYGFSEELAKSLRDLNSDGGRLREGPMFSGWKPLLPFASNEGIDCRRNLSESDISCFAAGDIRVNEQSGLIAMHTLWMREHNRLARELKELNPEWDGEKIYHEARKIVGAAMQHITYKYWLQFIVGRKGMKKLGEYHGYNPNIRPDISNVFATAALRFGHTLINPVLHRFDEKFQPIREGHLPLRHAFFAPWRVVNEGGIDPLLRGLFVVPAKLKKSTENLNTELTEQLFKTAHAVALDLAAMNVQRSRDHGLPSYLEYRKFCNMSSVESFDDLSFEITDEHVLKKLEEIYGHPGNIDVFVGGILEDPVDRGRVGPLFQCLLIEQFKRLRDGDRFYYENPSVFKPEQLVQIKQYSLARILCDNSDNITEVTRNVFVLPELQGGFTKCEDIPTIDLKVWSKCCDNDCNNNVSNEISRNRREIGKELELNEKLNVMGNEIKDLKLTVKKLRSTMRRFDSILRSINSKLKT